MADLPCKGLPKVFYGWLFLTMSWITNKQKTKQKRKLAPERKVELITCPQQML